MDSLNRIFWAGQEIYIMKIFLPVIIGFLVLYMGLLALSAFIFWQKHYRLWRLGKDENRFDQVLTRLKMVFAVIFANVRIWEELYPGIMHFFIFWGTILNFLGKIVRLFSYPVGLTNPPQTIFLYASFISEIGGLLGLISGGMAVVRRYIIKPSRLDTKLDNSLIFIWMFLILLTGYLIKGYRIASIGDGITPDWLSWAPVSYWASRLILILPTDPLNELLVWHRVLIHIIPVFLFFTYVVISRSQMQHMFLSPLSVFFRSLKPKGVPDPILDFEKAETFGVNTIPEFTWKQLLDLEACTACGRCQDACPAHLSEKPLSPKRMTLNLKEHLRREGPALLSTPPGERQPSPLVGNTVDEEEIWACTACMACEEVCPVYVEPLKRIIELRRYLVLMESKFPSSVRLALKNMQTHLNPWGVSRSLRAEWGKGLGVKQFSEAPDLDLLFWSGCAVSFDDRNKKVATTLLKILHACGIQFGILGTEEGCCGDSARRIGNEYLFQTMVEKNVEMMKHYGIKRILTMCPHCFHTLTNEYPQYGAEFEVQHYTQFLAELLSTGKLKLTKSIHQVITYHDSCYLGRGSEIYDAPRRILRSIPGLKLVEMKRHQNRSFCCGAGGGRMWMEEKIGKRINQMRTDQAIQTGASLIGTACPYCLTMLGDGIKEKGQENTLTVFDLSELVVQSM